MSRNSVMSPWVGQEGFAGHRSVVVFAGAVATARIWHRLEKKVRPVISEMAAVAISL
ncbi:MAG: hypothetical protein M1399_04895 [Actinobacteria bacterium]|nr:hypothetical protein [Actinomycetota bacterium]